MGDLILMAGAGLVVGGVSMLSVPAAVILTGAGLVLCGLAITSKTRAKKPAAAKPAPQGE